MWKVSMATRRARRNQKKCEITWCWTTTIASALTSTTLSAGTILDRWLGEIAISKIKQNFILHRFQYYLFKVRIRPVGQVSNWKEGLWWGHQGSVFWQRGGLCLQGELNYRARFFADLNGEQTQGLTLDIAGGNLLRLGKDGVILAASHGTRLRPIFDLPSF